MADYGRPPPCHHSHGDRARHREHLQHEAAHERRGENARQRHDREVALRRKRQDRRAVHPGENPGRRPPVDATGHPRESERFLQQAVRRPAGAEENGHLQTATGTQAATGSDATGRRREEFPVRDVFQRESRRQDDDRGPEELSRLDGCPGREKRLGVQESASLGASAPKTPKVTLGVFSL